MRKRFPLIAAGIAASSLVMLAAFTGSAVANDLHQTGNISASSAPVGTSDECAGLNLAPNTMLWHFVHTGTDGSDLPSTLYATFQNAGAQTAAGYSNGDGSAAVMYDIITPNPDTLLQPPTVYDTISNDGLLNLSHVCFGPVSQESSTGTEVHLGSTDSATPVVVDNANPASLGSTVHDSASITMTGTGTTAPSGSYVTFQFWKNGSCDGTATAMSGQYDVSGDSSPISVDPGMVAGPLAAGNYSFSASFTSGDTSKVKSSAGGCEPFKVSPADTTTSTSVVREDTSAVVASGGHLPLGTSVHDTATVNGQVSGFAASGTVTYHFYASIDCKTNEVSSATWPDQVTLSSDGSVPDSASTGALTPGDYGFVAVYSGDSNYNGSTGSCEPFTVDKANTTTTTQVHNAAHQDITNKDVAPGSFVHDNSSVGTQVGSFVIGGTVTYTLYTSGNCMGTTLTIQTVPVGTESTPIMITAVGSYSYLVTYSGDSNYNGSTASCEPFGVFNAPLTIGYWKTHISQCAPHVKTGTGGCNNNGPFTVQFLPLPLGNYMVNSGDKALAVFNANNCSSTTDQGAVGCLAAQLLAAELNVANSSNTCISSTIAAANAFLVSVGYTGPTGAYTLTSAQRTQALTLKTALDTYNNGGGC